MPDQEEASEREVSLSDEIESGVNDLSAQFRRCAEVGTMIRGNEGFGRKPKKSTLAYLSQWGPIDIHHYDEANDRTIIQSIHNTTAILEDNRRRRLSGHDGYSPSRELRCVASVGLGEYLVLKKGGIDIADRNDMPKFLALLDSNAGLRFRTAPGRVSRKPLRQYIAPRQKR